MLAIAQRAKNKKRVKAIHAKIKNTRQVLIQKLTSNLVKVNSLIVVGKIKPTSFTLSRLAKPVYGEGWFETKRQLDYKCANAEGGTELGIRAWFVVLVKRPITEMLMEQKTFSRSGLAVFSRNQHSFRSVRKSIRVFTKIFSPLTFLWTEFAYQKR